MQKVSERQGNKLKVDAINNGTVIDHIPGGAGLRVLDIVGGSRENIITLGIHLPSRSGAQKDLLKIEGREIKPEEVNQIALLAPQATINIIRNYKVVEKFPVKIPDQVEGLLRCPNPQCITNHESVKTRFVITQKNPVQLQCAYCERAYPAAEVQPNR
jgi:aspartate carbamoyltransferase regulatory subunit